MHDLGKVGIADKILLKPGRLDADEFEIMKKHAVLATNCCKGSSSRVCKRVPKLRWRTTRNLTAGYPQGPFKGRIFHFWTCRCGRRCFRRLDVGATL